MLRTIGVIVIGIVLTGAVFGAQPSGGDFVLVKSTIDGGGGVSAGGDFILTGTIGQADANQEISTGSDYALGGGFWARITELIADLIFKDGFE